MFESIFTSTSENTISISQSMLGILVAVVIGLVIAFVYTLVSKKDGYNKSFIIGLALLPAIVAAVILLVGSNVARAFSMAGAFALVRFRSAPGSAKDISVVFFAMATGLACGLGFVTEGAIPYAAADPLHVIPACIIGSGAAGAVSMFFKCTLMAPHGGIFVFPVVGNAIYYVIALVAGTIISTICLGLFKKKAA